MSPVAAVGLISTRAGAPIFPSIMPNIYLGSKKLPLTFYERFIGTAMDTIQSYILSELIYYTM